MKKNEPSNKATCKNDIKFYKQVKELIEMYLNQLFFEFDSRKASRKKTALHQIGLMSNVCQVIIRLPGFFMP